MVDTPGRHLSLFSWLSRWPEWVGFAAFLWSLLYGIFGIYWTFDRAGFPFGTNDVEADPYALFAGLRPEVGAPILAGLCIIGVIVALAITQGWGRKILQRALLFFSWGMGVVLAVLIPDLRILQHMAYALAFLYLGHITWTIWNQIICLLGGVLWIATALAYQRGLRGACQHCGRSPDVGRPGYSAHHWGKWFTIAAILFALPYALSRWAWALHIPLGIKASDLGVIPGLELVEFALGAVCVGGALLTLGLIQRWGEIFPRWFPFVSGKRVPPALAIVPASLVSIALISGALSFNLIMIRLILAKGWTAYNWGVGWPAPFFLLWGLALGGATLAYAYRRRGRCKFCGEQ
ncbi:hypothetical protein EPA93_19900 [Ktedonosporobacter rubrisoli]|uniref:Uncharacterized protein n=1 Tax=Ktedonosporobacter rubrisoli TaxID=2509675 RepID=A0A4P6JRM6_KTERU|nr:hypothetical protein [Ktedonosporobacter rubrisoli]QBD78137.1 hypothetical protein EPA93_19900 [Ktedonosporobacter rubrisoli]